MTPEERIEALEKEISKLRLEARRADAILAIYVGILAHEVRTIGDFDVKSDDMPDADRSWLKSIEDGIATGKALMQDARK